MSQLIEFVHIKGELLDILSFFEILNAVLSIFIMIVIKHENAIFTKLIYTICYNKEE